ncbi:hypothetical protein GCM10011491_15600 [Brucella endophytica]|uniref:Uncharacterized protein n=1 Tax=Brucella endophytica TaxID=1963359 RepID=A0A916S7Z2_9HYPH|nr:hypothetical protein [Brucella endophytica]GGA88682.1 hypothetical protein GCM10011491_15600 [Brucella endophytica]
MIGLDSHRVAAVDGLSWQLDLKPSDRPGLKPEISRLGGRYLPRSWCNTHKPAGQWV